MIASVRRIVLSLLVLAGCGRTAAPLSTDIGGGDPIVPGDPLVEETPFLLGQTSVNENSNLQNGLENPSGIAVCGGRLFVADNLQSRVLVWNSVPPTSRPDIVLGQPDFNTRNANYNNRVDAQVLNAPDGVACDATHLVVADSANSRVLIWSPLPTTNFEAASVVLGQPSFATSEGETTQTSLFAPNGVAMAGGRLYVADTTNNRVMVWTTLPTANAAPASFVLGQPDFSSFTANRGAAGTNRDGFALPTAIAATDALVAVADSGNNRVLVYLTPPADGTAQPDHVLGQANFTANADPGSAKSTRQPHGVSIWPDGSIAVGSGGDDAVKVFATPSADGPSAVHFIGQPSSVSTGEPYFDATTLYRPRYALPVGSTLYITDAFANRVLLYDITTLVDYPSAISVIGQPDLASGAKRCPAGGVSAARMGLPMDVVIDQGKLIVSDFLYHRVLIWNALPTAVDAPADIVLGQPTPNSYNPIADVDPESTFNFPTRTAVIGGNLYVVDRDYNRILVYDGVPTSASTGARYALGQPDLASTGASGPPGGTTWLQPTCVATDGARLAVCDSGHNRVLLWNAIPTDWTVQPDIVLGQPDKTSFGSNSGGVQATTMWIPRDAQFTENGIVVADQNNHRILIWDKLPVADGVGADVVLGQPDMTTGFLRAADGASTRGPAIVRYNGGLLYVGTNNRIMVWQGVPVTNNALASFVLGQTSATVDLANAGGMSAQTFDAPFGFAFANGQIYVADTENDRVIARPVPE